MILLHMAYHIDMQRSNSSLFRIFSFSSTPYFEQLNPPCALPCGRVTRVYDMWLLLSDCLHIHLFSL